MEYPFANLLIDRLPETVSICGVEREINSDFRTALLFECLMEDAEVEDEEKTIRAIELFYPELPKSKEEFNDCIDKMLWFYRCGKELNEYLQRKAEAKKENGQPEQRIYDITYDDDYIYAAFVQQYGIDLNRIEYMHWWKFKALFKSLTNDTEFVKIMEFRGMDIDKDLTPEQKKYYQKMKSIYALPQPKEEVERMRSIEAALMGNGDLSGIL